ncbi:attractin isoform X1 [Thrips palmi]|uniref:Attractin isoform X1 n=2 Tax=Thrips palmi TaxID=161013 RepID=A0A6P8Y885_THRPL|nr:attractin isoform X1 [Thrips palmi]
MAAYLQMFLFIFKSKYRRKWDLGQTIVCLCLVLFYSFCVQCKPNCSDVQCINGECVNGTCVCNEGWQGSACQFCGGKVRLSEPRGTIHDGYGNYSIDVKCSWLVDSGSPNTSIHLHLEEFATECGWDHLYIFDGDSVHSPLLGVFSGLMYKGNYSVRRIPEIVAHSGSALIHFYSDVAYNMTGFNITYRFNSCPSRYSHLNCSGNGVCIDGVCTCDALYTGPACDVPKCPNNCTGFDHGYCNLEKHQCECYGRYRGDDCSQMAELGFWEVLHPKDFQPEGSASHCAVVWKDSLYIVGGESYHRAKMLYTYDFNGEVWETPQMEYKNAPRPRYGHSCVMFGDKIFMYGGVEISGEVSSDLWAFDVNAKTWENITVRSESCNTTGNSSLPCGPLQSAGHTATLVNKSQRPDRMVIIFGHSPRYGHLHTVQEFIFGTREWNVVKTRGYPVRGGYGHSSALDPLTQLIYVYGGFIYENSLILSNRLYSYEPNSRTWRLLMSAPSGRFLHTASFISGGLMIVFGGNTHNDTAHSHGAKCYSSDLLAYDVLCDSWSPLPLPPRGLSRADLARFGHSAVMFDGSLHIYGGFDGQMLSDILRYTPGICSSQIARETCVGFRTGVKCVWNQRDEHCINASTAFNNRPLVLHSDGRDEEAYDNGFSICPEEGRAVKAAAVVMHEELCKSYSDCSSCVQTSYSCQWCQGQSKCSYRGERCKNSHPVNSNNIEYSTNVLEPIRSLDQCEPEDASVCPPPPNSCHRWDYEVHCNSSVDSQQSQQELCKCSDLKSCYNCTRDECIWCQNEGRCIDKNAYTTSFPYGQCREWTTQQARCRSTVSGKSSCSFYLTCAECRDDPACGWCDHGSGTGLGTCLPGGNMGPDHDYTCPARNWYFTDCPLCQCNGHSTCPSNSSMCNQPCGNMTQGEKCERCVPGYYGIAINGGTCSPCECNDQGTLCNQENGKCFCTTKGISGDHCERCDTANHYHGDPTNHGSCFYDLTIDYQFTFNLSKKEDRHYTQINFKNSPPKPDIDADFTITCSVMAKMNITIKTAKEGERQILVDHNCTTFRTRFTKAEHNFGMEENVTLTTFYVYVYDFHTPLWIQISFSQYPKLNLQQFFITFSSCFLLLLLVAAILWKIKQKYDMYRRRQRLFVEMEQMASRPFSQVLVEIERREKVVETNAVDTDTQQSSIASLRKRKKMSRQDSPSPIALEPCCGNRAAVLSLLIRLPTGSEVFTPQGQSAGLAIASALVTLGNPRKVSVDPANKCDQKSSKSRKSVSSQHPDSCI